MLHDDNSLLKRNVEELSILSDFANAVGGTSDLNKIMNTVVHRSLAVFQAEQGVINLVERGETDSLKTLMRIAATSSTKKVFHFNEGMMGWMLLNKKPLLLNDPRTHPEFNRIHWDEPIKSLLCAPLMVKGNLTGALTIYNSEGRTFTSDDERLLSIIAIQIAQVIENARIEEEKRMNQFRIARDLHDDVASSLSSIALYAENLKLQLGVVSPYASELIEKINALSVEAIETMSDIVWSIAPENNSFDQLVLRLKNVAIDLCNAKGVRHHIQIPSMQNERIIPTDIRRALLLIFKEALNNMIKHSQAKNFTANIEITDGIILMILRDDGIGFQPSEGHIEAQTERGHGLRNMKHRAEEINSELEILSTPGKGTTVHFQKNMT